MDILSGEAVFIDDSPYGRIIIDEVWEFYDCPVLFVGKSSLNKKYVVLSVDTSYNEWHWFMVEINDGIYNGLMNNEIDLYDAFKKPLNGEVIRYIDAVKGKRFEIIKPEDLLDDELPEKEVCLNV